MTSNPLYREDEFQTVAARYGYVNGTGGTSVAVNRPPVSGAYAGRAGAVEVIVQQPQQRLFSAVLASSPLNISARAVALSGSGDGCVLALNRTASVDISALGNPQVMLNGCSLYDNSSSPTALTVGGAATISALSVSVVGGVSGASKITTTEGIVTGGPVVRDPYADVPLPQYTPGCECHTGSTLDPGVYCGKRRGREGKASRGRRTRRGRRFNWPSSFFQGYYG